MSGTEEAEPIEAELRVGDTEFLEEVVERTKYDTASEMVTALVTEALHNFSRGEPGDDEVTEVELDPRLAELYEDAKDKKGEHPELELMAEFMLAQSISQGVEGR